MFLGYSSAVKVVEVGTGINDFSLGDMVACFGGGFASHAEYITVPKSLCEKIPESVSTEEVAFVMLGIIAIHKEVYTQKHAEFYKKVLQIE